MQYSPLNLDLNMEHNQKLFYSEDFVFLLIQLFVKIVIQL